MWPEAVSILYPGVPDNARVVHTEMINLFSCSCLFASVHFERLQLRKQLKPFFLGIFDQAHTDFSKWCACILGLFAKSAGKSCLVGIIVRHKRRILPERQMNPPAGLEVLRLSR